MTSTCIGNFLCTHVVSHAAERNSIFHLSEMLVLKVEVKLVFFFILLQIKFNWSSRLEGSSCKTFFVISGQGLFTFYRWSTIFWWKLIFSIVLTFSGIYVTFWLWQVWGLHTCSTFWTNLNRGTADANMVYWHRSG